MTRRALLLIAVVTPLFLAGHAKVGQGAQAAAFTPSSVGSASRVKVGPVPLVKQVFRNNCETAALAMVLASVGVRVDQRRLQRELRRSGPLDPIISPDGTWIWGAPDEGFVGRAEGGGVAGGFGVYQGPIRQLAARYRVHLDDLSRRDVTDIVSRLRQGRPVLSWIGLSEGPYRRWRTPAGRLISVNLGEHAVVLTGVSNGMILVNDPLTGTRLRWSVSEYAAKWRLLGQRAVGL